MARSVPLSRSTLRVGGGSAFYVRHRASFMKHSIKVSLQDGEVVIEADRDGLRRISEISARLAALTDSEARTPANHFHLMESMKNVEPDSLPLVILRNDA